MKERRMINLPISFEYLLSFLFGKHSYHGFVGQKSMGRWKKESLKIVKTMKKAIILNVDTDNFYKEELAETCEYTIQNLKSSKTIDQISIYMIECLVKIVFSLLGNMPDNWDKKKANHPTYWKLDRFRKLTYTQTTEQKVNLILNRALKHNAKNPSYRDLSHKLWRDFKGNRIDFLKWYKENYRKEYLEIT